MPAPAAILDLVARFRANLDSYKRGAVQRNPGPPRVHRPVLQSPGLGRRQRAGLRRGLQGRDPRGRHQGRRRHQGARLLLPHRRHPQVLRRGQEALGRHQRGRAPGLPAPPLRLDRQAAAQHPHRLRGVRGLRLPHQAGQGRQAVHGAGPLPDLTTTTPTAGTRSPASSPATPILKGSFDKYAESNKGKRGTAEVDAAFLEEIERWRELLAHNLALRNPGLSQRELNFAVQQTIDRIIFLRICEDRGIEPYGTLLGAAQRRRGLPAPAASCFRQRGRALQLRPVPLRDGERGRGDAPDTLTLALAHRRQGAQGHPQAASTIPTAPTSSPCCRPTSWARSTSSSWARSSASRRATRRRWRRSRRCARPAASSTPPPTSSIHRAPDLGKLLAGLTLRQVAGMAPRTGARRRPAGAGHGVRLRLFPARRLPVPAGLVPGPVPGRWSRRGRQAKVGDGPQPASLPEQPRRVAADHRRAQAHPAGPHLRRGHRPAGRGGDQALAAAQGAGGRGRADPRPAACPVPRARPARPEPQHQVRQLADRAGLLRASRWRCWTTRRRCASTSSTGRPSSRRCLRTGGFDVVIGNPPYIRIQMLKEWAPLEVEYYKGRYRAAGKGNYDIYVVFVEKALSLLNERGRMGFILPHKFLGDRLWAASSRRLLLNGRRLSTLVDSATNRYSRPSDNLYLSVVFVGK